MTKVSRDYGMIEAVMKWNVLRSVDQIKDIRSKSNTSPVLVFKHSTRCNISRTSLDRLERNWKEEEMQDVQLYFLDLLAYREISNKLSEEFGVEHESPQVLIIKDGKSLYDRSHFDIEYREIKEAVKS
jgi:bacillithiol system protein YtxJ